jgi:hypothetical protein
MAASVVNVAKVALFVGGGGFRRNPVGLRRRRFFSDGWALERETVIFFVPTFLKKKKKKKDFVLSGRLYLVFLK